MFADDLIIFSALKRGIQSSLNDLEVNMKKKKKACHSQKERKKETVN